jgi:hypothetical protein
MKYTKLLPLLALLICVIIFQSCGGDDPCENVTCLNDGVCIDGNCDCLEGFIGSDCGTPCREAIFGNWNVTNLQPVGCSQTLITYVFGTGISNSIISVTLNDETNTWTGEGLLDSDCGEMTYTVSGNGDIISGAITFDGSILVDMTSLGCLITAAK